MNKNIKVILTPKQQEVIKRSLDLNYLSTDIEEEKDDKEFYKDLKSCKKAAQQVTDKINKEIKEEKMIKCSICKQKIKPKGSWTQGNNAQPINNGRCCDKCNNEKVIPERLRRVKRW